jgi:hypothetical protein
MQMMISTSMERFFEYIYITDKMKLDMSPPPASGGGGAYITLHYFNGVRIFIKSLAF